MSKLHAPLWSSSTREYFQLGETSWLSRPLEATYTVQDKNFSDAVAWAALLGIVVLMPSGGGLGEHFRLMKPGHAPVVVPVCSPEQLIKTLRDFAAGVLFINRNDSTAISTTKFSARKYAQVDI